MTADPISAATAFRYFQHLSNGFAPGPMALPASAVGFHDAHISGEGTIIRTKIPARSTNLVAPTEVKQGAIWVTGLLRHRGHLVPVRSPLLVRTISISPDNVAHKHRLGRVGPWTLVPGLLSPGTARNFLERSAIRQHPLIPESLVDAREVIAETFADSPPPTIDTERFGIWHAADERPNPAALRSWKLGDVPGTAFHHFYGPMGAHTPPPVAPTDPLRVPLPLNEQQERIVRSAQHGPLTVVSGPPGTGKTHLVLALALEQFGRGRSTLIATGSEAAADSIEEMLSQFPMITAIRFGGAATTTILGNQLAEGVPSIEPRFSTTYTDQRLKELTEEQAEHRRRLLVRLTATRASDESGARRERLPRWLTDVPDLATLEPAEVIVQSLEARKLSWLERRRAKKSLRLILGAPRSTGLDELKIAHDHAREIAVAEAPLSEATTAELWSRAENAQHRSEEAIADHFEALRRAGTDPKARRTLGQLATALREPNPVDRQFAIGEASKDFVAAVPLWFGTLEHLDRALPPVPAMFDLVVFDEASQASQMRGASALLRAKRAVVIGDPRQMRHSPTSTAEERIAAESALHLTPDIAAQLDEAKVSLFDAAAQQVPVARLDEHFRSSPHIIGFSNDRFYNENLRLMTQHPGRESRDCIHDITTPLVVNEHGHLTSEMHGVALEIEKLMGYGARSLGVVGGLPEHADALRNYLDRTFSAVDQKRISLRVGTPQEFQGIERDTMIISPGIHPGNLDRLPEMEDPNAFNVIVTRAHRDVYVITPMTIDTLPEGLLRDYLIWSHQPPPAFRTHVDATGWQGRLAAELARLGDLRVIVDYPVGGYTVDLALGTGLLAFGVETSVHPDGVDAHITRHLALRRAGWTMLDAFEADWRGRLGECVSWLAATAASRSSQ